MDPLLRFGLNTFDHFHPLVPSGFNVPEHISKTGQERKLLNANPKSLNLRQALIALPHA
jgi:hypothetical protein